MAPLSRSSVQTQYVGRARFGAESGDTPLGVMKHGSTHENKTRDGQESDNAVEHKTIGRVLIEVEDEKLGGGAPTRAPRPILRYLLLSLLFLPLYNLLCTILESPRTSALAFGTSLYSHNVVHTMVWERYAQNCSRTRAGVFSAAVQLHGYKATQLH
jgi:hypothetical protein